MIIIISKQKSFIFTQKYLCRLMRNCVDMSTLMLPAATMTTMTNTAPIAVAQPKADPVKGTLLGNNNNNTSSNKQGRIELETVRVV